jgi:hypothetical protein
MAGKPSALPCDLLDRSNQFPGIFEKIYGESPFKSVMDDDEKCLVSHRYAWFLEQALARMEVKHRELKQSMKQWGPAQEAPNPSQPTDTK